MKRNFINYDKTELINKIDKISIERLDNQIITKYDNVVRSISNVSKLYEIFDIKSYLKSKIDVIEKNFTISKYYFRISKGIQELILLSDSINIEGIDFYKSFFILNSSDKSRKLNFNAGLYSKDFYAILSAKNLGLTKKHLNGVTKAAEAASEGLSGESFDEQIENLKSLVGHRISMSKLKSCIVLNDENKSEHLKFDSLKNHILTYSKEGRLKLEDSQYKILKTKSENIIFDNSNDFYVDAFWAFQIYLRLFNKQDSHVVKKETLRIMAITQWSVRNQILESIGI